MDELSQLDELIESDILDALGQDVVAGGKDSIEDNDEIMIEDFNDPIPQEESNIEPLEQKDLNEKIEENIIDTNESNDDISKVNANLNTSDLASLLSQLLNNKTIEITIKIKD